MDFTLIIVIYSVVSAGFSAYIASEKNRDGASWFFTGLFFGLFALIAISAVPVLPDQTELEVEAEVVRDKAKPIKETPRILTQAEIQKKEKRKIVTAIIVIGIVVIIAVVLIFHSFGPSRPL